MLIAEFSMRVGIADDAVAEWIEAGWLLPLREGEACRFSDIDLARACLIRDLKHDLGANDEAIPIILHLIDQIHGLRRVMTEFQQQIAAGDGRATSS
jgi:chaperone modulatory protein CbpM